MGFLFFHHLSDFLLFMTSIMAGMVIILGLNAVNATPSFILNYYKYVKKDENALPTYPLFWKNVLTYYIIVTEVSQAVLQPLNLIPFFRRFSYLFRLEFGSMIALSELLIVLLMPHAGASELGAGAGILIAGFVGGLGRAVFENTVFALFGTCPSKIIIGAMIGLSASGAVMSTIQIVLFGSMASDFHSILKQSIIYFCLAICIVLISAALLLCLFLNPYAKTFIPELRSSRSFWGNIYRRLKPEDDALQPGHVGDSPDKASTSKLNSNQNVSTPNPFVEPMGVIVTQKAAGTVAEDAEVDAEGLTSSELLQTVSLRHVIKEIYPMQIACFLTFFVSLLLFPGLLLAVDSTNAWFTILIIATFNYTDLAGRVILLWKKLRMSRKAVLILSIARLAFIPLIVLCATHKIPGHGPAFIFTGLIGLTNGYVGTLTMMYAPTSPGLRGNGEEAMAAQGCDAALMLGCSTGALAQLAVVMAL